MIKIREEKGKIIIEADKPVIEVYNDEYRLDINKEFLEALFKYCIKNIPCVPIREKKK